MARLEESNMIEGRYETRIIDGQTVKERYYRALGHGLRCWEATRDFYARFAILAGTTPGLEVAP